MTKSSGVNMRAYSLRKPGDKPAADLPEERKSNEVLGPNKVQKELLALKNANRLLEEQLQSTGGLDTLKLTQQLEERDASLAEAVQSLQESRLLLQRNQRELDTTAESTAKLRLDLAEQKKKTQALASSSSSSSCPAAAIASPRADVDQLQEEVVALRADNQVLEERALQASMDLASASQNAAQVRQQLAASIGERAAASEALAELQLQLAQRDLQIAESDQVHARFAAEIASAKRDAATNKAAVAKTLELLAVRDAELAEARHQVFVSQRSTQAKQRQTNQHTPTVVVHGSSELAAKDAIIAKLELTLAKQEALLAGVKAKGTNATSEAQAAPVTPAKQPAKPKKLSSMPPPRSSAPVTVPTSIAEIRHSLSSALNLESAPGKFHQQESLEERTFTSLPTGPPLKASAVQPDVAASEAPCIAKVPSNAAGADWSIFD